MDLWTICLGLVDEALKEAIKELLHSSYIKSLIVHLFLVMDTPTLLLPLVR